MKITIEDYPGYLLQDIKWMILERGFDFTSDKQIDKNTVEMTFTEKKESEK